MTNPRSGAIIARVVRWACSAVGSAPHSHCGGRGFESLQVHHVGASFLSLAPTFFTRVRARLCRCASFPNRTRSAGLRFGVGCRPENCGIYSVLIGIYAEGIRRAVKKTFRWHVFRPRENPSFSGCSPEDCRRETKKRRSGTIVQRSYGRDEPPRRGGSLNTLIHWQRNEMRKGTEPIQNGSSERLRSRTIRGILSKRH